MKLERQIPTNLSEQERLPQPGIENIHKHALALLEEVGISVGSPEATNLLADAGAIVEDGRAFLPPKLVENAVEAIRTSSQEIQMYDREGNPSILLQNGNTYFGPGSDAIYQIDPDTHELRDTELADIGPNVRLADALEHYEFIMSMGLPQDVVPSKLYPTVFAEMLKNTSKPIVTTLTTLSDIKNIHAIACVAADGEQKLKETPHFLAYLEPISPLKIDDEGAKRVLYCAEHEIPFVFAAGANLGATAPIALEWGVMQGHAESLAGLVLAYVKNPDAKFVYGANTAAMDMRTSKVAYGSPEWAKTVGMYAQLGRELNLPSWGTAGCSDSFHLDAQAGAEGAESILYAMQNSPTLVHDMGYLGHGEINDPAFHIFVNTYVERAKALLDEPDYSDEFLQEGIGVIYDVARGGEIFPAHMTTAKRFRQDLWIPPKTWQKGNVSKYPGERFEVMLRGEARKIMATHNPGELGPKKLRKIDSILGNI